MWSGVIDGQDVILAKAGLGKVNTAALAGIIWERHHSETMLFTGVAGGLDPSLGIGDIVIGERTIQHDWGVIASDGLERYQAGLSRSTTRLRYLGLHPRHNWSKR